MKLSVLASRQPQLPFPTDSSLLLVKLTCSYISETVVSRGYIRILGCLSMKPTYKNPSSVKHTKHHIRRKIEVEFQTLFQVSKHQLRIQNFATHSIQNLFPSQTWAQKEVACANRGLLVAATVQDKKMTLVFDHMLVFVHSKPTSE